VVPTFFAGTLFVSAALLFLVQPMFARMVLPWLGGSPSVWNTCNFFFQAVLLAGYGYAHWASKRLGIRGQAALQVGLLLAAFVVLPVGVAGADLSPESHPVLTLLSVLVVSLGLPFFALAASAPLLQRWYASTSHAHAHDPYFLYAASNLGSMLALLSYPILLEPNLRLAEQSSLWAIGYGVLAVLTLGCALLAWRTSRPLSGEPKATAVVTAVAFGSPLNGMGARLRLIALAFVPSSLLLSVTTYLTTDIAAIPLLWVLPLALYLLTFILTFARRPPIPHRAANRVLPLVMIVLTLVMLSEATEPVALLMALHLLGLFVVGLVCHGELAARRPEAEELTEFYLWIALGGVLGGLFNAVLAPLIFPALIEYPLALVTACLLRQPNPPPKGEAPPATWQFTLGKRQFAIARADLAFPLVIGLLTAGLILVYGREPGPVSVGLSFGVPVLLCYFAQDHPLRFGLSLGAVFLAGVLYQGVYGGVLHRERDFFGIHRVTIDPVTGDHLLVHGNTVHGQQSQTRERRREALTYYHRTGPIGQVFTTFSGNDARKRVAVVGLGAGSLLAYGESGQIWTYFEIDPTVVRIAQDRRFFTFWSDCPAQKEVKLGDARLQLQRDTGQYDLLVIDAFTSDAIPLHLLTREALQIYLARLADKGLLAFHISNRYLDLHPVLANLAHDAKLACWAQDEEVDPEVSRRYPGKTGSEWVILAREPTSVQTLVASGKWRRLPEQPGQPVWTDDFSNLWSVFRWR
jgi:hypothetical protein